MPKGLAGTHSSSGGLNVTIMSEVVECATADRADILLPLLLYSSLLCGQTPWPKLAAANYRVSDLTCEDLALVPNAAISSNHAGLVTYFFLVVHIWFIQYFLVLGGWGGGGSRIPKWWLLPWTNPTNPAPPTVQIKGLLQGERVVYRTVS